MKRLFNPYGKIITDTCPNCVIHGHRNINNPNNTKREKILMEITLLETGLTKRMQSLRQRTVSRNIPDWKKTLQEIFAREQVRVMRQFEMIRQRLLKLSLQESRALTLLERRPTEAELDWILSHFGRIITEADYIRNFEHFYGLLFTLGAEQASRNITIRFLPRRASIVRLNRTRC